MTTCVLVCEGCTSRKPFPVEEEELTKLRGGGTVPRHCPTCRNTSNWEFTGLDRRGADRRVADRRLGGDRRAF